MIDAKNQLSSMLDAYAKKQNWQAGAASLTWKVPNSDTHHNCYYRVDIDKYSGEDAVQFRITFYASEANDTYYDMGADREYKPRWRAIKPVNNKYKALAMYNPSLQDDDNLPTSTIMKKQFSWFYYHQNKPWLIAYSGNHLKELLEIVFLDSLQQLHDFMHKEEARHESN